jgi:hypothetical protein
MSSKQHVIELPRRWKLGDALNGTLHRTALMALAALVIGHWAEHLAQARQNWRLHWPREQSLGLLGLAFPWLVRSEQLHYWIALGMVLGLLVLGPEFTGPARAWWDVTLGIQLWHHLEHMLLSGQSLLGMHLLGRAVPTSILQLALPRVELHLAYNALVTLPMAIAVYLHARRRQPRETELRCTCARPLRVRRAEYTAVGDR